jgi:pyrroline-5-carboxylate reductase
MDVVTAVSGSGPAYFYLLAEALRDAAVRLGLPPETANRLAVGTAHGSGLMAQSTDTDIAELRRRVTSTGGTTQAAIAVLQAGGLEQLVADADDAATRRGRELSNGPGPA